MDSRRQKTTARLLQWRATHGYDAFRQAVAGGQYTHPLGIFYGGDRASWSRRTQTAIFDTYLHHARRVGVVDYHTGLGPTGYAERLTVWSPDSPEFKRAKTWFGAALTSTKSSTHKVKSTAADVAGDNISGSASLFREAEITGIAFEVGTLPLLDVLQALRADAWLHAHGDLQSEEGRLIKAQVRAAFYCETDVWKGMVAGQSLSVCRQAIAGLLS